LRQVIAHQARAVAHHRERLPVAKRHQRMLGDAIAQQPPARVVEVGGTRMIEMQTGLPMVCARGDAVRCRKRTASLDRSIKLL